MAPLLFLVPTTWGLKDKARPQVCWALLEWSCLRPRASHGGAASLPPPWAISVAWGLCARAVPVPDPCGSGCSWSEPAALSCALKASFSPFPVRSAGSSPEWSGNTGQVCRNNSRATTGRKVTTGGLWPFAWQDSSVKLLESFHSACPAWGGKQCSQASLASGLP